MSQKISSSMNFTVLADAIGVESKENRDLLNEMQTAAASGRLGSPERAIIAGLHRIFALDPHHDWVFENSKQFSAKNLSIANGLQDTIDYKLLIAPDASEKEKNARAISIAFSVLYAFRAIVNKEIATKKAAINAIKTVTGKVSARKVAKKTGKHQATQQVTTDEFISSWTESLLSGVTTGENAQISDFIDKRKAQKLYYAEFEEFEFQRDYANTEDGSIFEYNFSYKEDFSSDRSLDAALQLYLICLEHVNTGVSTYRAIRSTKELAALGITGIDAFDIVEKTSDRPLSAFLGYLKAEYHERKYRQDSLNRSIGTVELGEVIADDNKALQGVIFTEEERADALQFLKSKRSQFAKIASDAGFDYKELKKALQENGSDSFIKVVSDIISAYTANIEQIDKDKLLNKAYKSAYYSKLQEYNLCKSGDRLVSIEEKRTENQVKLVNKPIEAMTVQEKRLASRLYRQKMQSIANTL